MVCVSSKSARPPRSPDELRRIPGKPPHVAIVEARFYEDISDALAQGATAALTAAGASWERVAVPGALEIPAAIALLAARPARSGRRFDGFVALGCVIRGETTHYETVCNDSSRAISMLGLGGACIGNGILTVENRAQALARAEVAGQNKGGGAALAALHLLALSRKWARSATGIGFRA